MSRAARDVLFALALPAALAAAPGSARADEPCTADAADSHECPLEGCEGCDHCDTCSECNACDGCEGGECCAQDRRVALDLFAGAQMISRHLRFNDDVYGAMRDYTLSAGPSVTVGGRWFPGAHFTQGVGSAFGVDVRFDRSFGITSSRAGLIEYDTVQRIVEVGAVGRYVGHRYEVVAGLGIGSHVFAFQNAVPTTPDLDTTPDTPNANYRYLKVGVDGRYMPFDFLGFGFGAAGLVVVDAGGFQSQSWFPRSDVGGLSLWAKVIVPLPHDLELRAGAEYRRFFHDMNARLGDPLIVGGALDQYTAAELTVAYRH